MTINFITFCWEYLGSSWWNKLFTLLAFILLSAVVRKEQIFWWISIPKFISFHFHFYNVQNATKWLFHPHPFWNVALKLITWGAGMIKFLWNILKHYIEWMKNFTMPCTNIKFRKRHFLLQQLQSNGCI